MKRPVAIALVSVGNTLLTLAFGWLALGLFFILPVIPLILLAAHVTGVVFLKRVYIKRGWLTPWKYWLCTSVPAAVVSVLGFVLVLILDEAGFFKGFLGGAAEGLIGLSCSIYSVVFLVVGVIALCPPGDEQGGKS
ncbi:MAG: hypothetical protein SPD47_09010 [Oscillospiraceae bacterium]|nr:hypothetical protein [Oscillospiraceae bacterium]